GRAVLPPGVVEPVRHYRQPPPPGRSTGKLIAQILGWIALVLLVVVSGLAGGLYLYEHVTLSAIAPHTKSAIASSKDLHPIASPSLPATALVVGYDVRRGSEHTMLKDSRSDTIML